MIIFQRLTEKFLVKYLLSLQSFRFGNLSCCPLFVLLPEFFFTFPVTSQERVLMKTNAKIRKMYIFMILQGKGRVITEPNEFYSMKSFTPIASLL